MSRTTLSACAMSHQTPSADAPSATVSTADLLAHVVANHAHGAQLAQTLRVRQRSSQGLPRRSGHEADPDMEQDLACDRPHDPFGHDDWAPRQPRSVKAQALCMTTTRSADGLVWSAMLILLLACAGAVMAGVHWVKPTPPSAEILEKRIGAHRIVVPARLLGPRPDHAAREVGMLRLRLTWPGLQPAEQNEAAAVHLTLSPAGKEPEPAHDPDQVLAMAGRFLQPIAWSNPGGLVARGFLPGSPYENEELFMSQPDGRDFFARCSAGIAPDEGCRTLLRHEGLDISLRFPREALVQWPALVSGIERLLTQMAR